jgi:hypothetical protein
MHVRSLLLAAAVIGLASDVGAEPPKSQTIPLSRRTSPVVMASAEQIPAGVLSARPTSVPVKRPRAARVTSCRCGDQIGGPAEEQR